MRDLLRETIREMLQHGPVVRVLRVGSYPITVEIAITPEEQQLGLMHRQHLDPDCGMLFPYDEPQELSFWMRDTHIPLSIAFIDSEGRIAGISDMEPGSEARAVSSQPCRWALEANKGWFRERNIKVGAQVSGLDV